MECTEPQRITGVRTLVQAAGTGEPDISGMTLDALEPPAGRHAALHDFCMCIPYGALLLAGGLVSLGTGGGSAGAALCLFGCAHSLLAVLSLRAWKRGASSAPYTALSAGMPARGCRFEV